MGLHLKLAIVAFFTFILTDMIWLGFVAKNMYINAYQPWLRLVDGQLQPIWWAALIVYVLFAIGTVIFILPLSHGALLPAALYGALLGAIIYGIYDFTCLSIFKDFPIGMAFVDWAWGSVLCAWSGFVTAYVASHSA